MNRIKVSAIEDDAKLRQTLSVFLNRSRDMRFVSGYGSAEEALQNLPQDRPDIILMDIRLPGISGIECVTALRQLMPDAHVIMLTAYEDSQQIFESLAAGAYGYLLKSTEPARLLDAIREVYHGGSPVSGSVARKILEYFQRPSIPGPTDGEKLALSERESQVLELLGAGHPYKHIADATGISLNTVRTYIKRIYEKLHVNSRTEAVLKFRAQNRKGAP